MHTGKRALLSWSGGKDCAWALHYLRQRGDVEVIGLVTTVDAAEQRVGMHRVRRPLLEAQADALGLPLTVVPLPWPVSNAEYEAALGDALRRAAEGHGIQAVAFGDLFLEDIRRYREGQMQRLGLEPVFPLWGLPTRELAQEMVAGGLRARTVCVQTPALPASFAGRAFDASFLADLPGDVDPCGENGEFHTFVWDGPGFRGAVAHTVGSSIPRDGHVFTNLLDAPPREKP